MHFRLRPGATERVTYASAVERVINPAKEGNRFGNCGGERGFLSDVDTDGQRREVGMGGRAAAGVFGYGRAGEVNIKEGNAAGAFGGECDGGLFADAAGWGGLVGE